MTEKEATNIGEDVFNFYQKLHFNESEVSLSGNLPADINEILKQQFNPDFYKVIDSGNVGQGKTAIELGCGVGWLAACFAIAFPNINITAVDFSDRAIKQAVELQKKHSINNLTIKKFDLAKDDYEKLGTFNYIFSTGVLHHTGALPRIVKNLHLISNLDTHLFLGLYHKYKRKPFLDFFVKNENKLDSNQLWELFTNILPSGYDDVRKKSWFEDQVNHPHETQHTVVELLNLTSEHWKPVFNSISGKRILTEDELNIIELKQAEIGKNNLQNGFYDPGFFISHFKRDNDV